MIERRTPAAEPSENMGHRILVVCNKLDLQLNIEPIFATLALYDVKSKRKVSENFHFDMNRYNHYHIICQSMHSGLVSRIIRDLDSVLLYVVKVRGSAL